MKKIIIVTKDMNVGGVEKSLISLLNTIDYSKYEIDLLLLEKYGDFLNEIPKDVNIIIFKEYKFIKDEVNLSPMLVLRKYIVQKKIKRFIKLLLSYIKTKITNNYTYYYKSIFDNIPILEKKYNVAIVYTSIINYLTWYVKYHIKADSYIGWIHFDISKLVIDKKLMLSLHKDMDKVYVVSKEALQSFVQMFPQLKSKCELKYNIVDSKKILQMSKEKVSDITTNKNEKIIVTLGRLTSEKGQDIIPDVALKLKIYGLKFKWYIVGDGYLKESIINRCKYLNISDNVILLGKKINPYPYLSYADIYVQTSIHEGFCITIAEAKMFGMPIVSTKFAGAYEQLNKINNYKIVDRDIEQMVDAIVELLK